LQNANALFGFFVKEHTHFCTTPASVQIELLFLTRQDKAIFSVRDRLVKVWSVLWSFQRQTDYTMRREVEGPSQSINEQPPLPNYSNDPLVFFFFQGLPSSSCTHHAAAPIFSIQQLQGTGARTHNRVKPEPFPSDDIVRWAGPHAT
jgi:hypothetical protein